MEEINKYTLIIYSYGEIIKKFESTDINYIRDIYYNYNEKDVGIDLFINDERIKFLNQKQALFGFSLFKYNIHSS